MPHPATTSELLLQQAVDLLTEVRDLLRSAQPPPSAPPSPPTVTGRRRAPSLKS